MYNLLITMDQLFAYIPDCIMVHIFQKTDYIFIKSIPSKSINLYLGLKEFIQ